MSSRDQRRALEATFPKCPCGATLGVQRVKAGVTHCRGCVPDAELDRQDALRMMEDRAMVARTTDDLAGVVVDLLRYLRNNP
jgi:hypothetical protein